MTSRDNFESLTRFILDSFGTDISGFKDNFFSRRVEIAMKRLKCSSVEELMEKLKKDEEALHKFFSILLINVSRFFRNLEVFNFVKEDIIPELSKNVKEINALSAGCSTGEETYSIAVILEEASKSYGFKYRVEGWDIHKHNIDFAQRGIYPREREVEIPPEFKCYFKIDQSGMSPLKEIKDKCSFHTRNILQDSPSSSFHLIFLRNLLIFQNKVFQNKILRKILEFSDKFCYLILGKVETISPELKNLYEPVSLKMRIYKVIKP